LILFALVGCGHAARPEPAPASRPPDAAVAAAPTPDAAPVIDAPRPLAQDPAALAAGLVSLYEDVAAAAAASTDCATIASGIDALRPKHAPLLDALRKADAAGKSAEVKAALDPYKDRVRAALDTITSKTATCSKDGAVEKAIDALFGG
jgi:hypothetical protein